MTGTTPGGAVIIWVAEGTWQAAVDAGARLAPAGLPVTLLHVIAAELPDTVHAAYQGLLGRGQRRPDPGRRVSDDAAASARDLLAAAASRLGRPCDRAQRSGVPGREVVTATAGASLLVMARDGDPARLGPRSLGRDARFVVDHAPCPVLLVWPQAPPALTTIPPPPGTPPRRR